MWSSFDGKDIKKIKATLLVFVIVAATFLVVIPMSSPQVKALTHLQNTTQEDWTGVGPPGTYDMDPRPFYVQWPHTPGSGEDHIINDPLGYTVDPGYTLIIPALDYTFMPFTQSEIYINPPATSITVYGTLETRTDAAGPVDMTKTFFSSQMGSWDGIYFQPGSRGMIQDCRFAQHGSGLVYLPGSIMISPGIDNSTFEQSSVHDLQMDGVVGYTNINRCQFTDPNSAQLISIENCVANITNSQCISHGDHKSQLYLSNADVYAKLTWFDGNLQAGHLVEIDSDCNNTVFDYCTFQNGYAGDYYVNASGSTPLFENCTFNTGGGQMSVLAKDDSSSVPAYVAVLNPTADGNPGFWDDTFDNSTLSAMGTSLVALQWYMNVHVSDPDGHSIKNSPVNITADYGSLEKLTGLNGWANWSVVTEFVRFEIMTMNFNTFNVSAKNFTETGYAIPEPTMDMSKEIYIIVPFSAVPNTPPSVPWLPSPGTVSGYVLIEYRLEDPDETDNGSLEIIVEYSTDGKTWKTATQGPGGDPMFNLYNNTVYYFEWDSLADIGSIYNETVYIRITPSDLGGPGTPGQTGPFIVDNQPPILVSGPTATATDNSVVITWEVNEPASAAVWYGLYNTFTNEVSNASMDTIQSIEITGLLPGRNYSYIINSTDMMGSKYSSDPVNWTFVTKIYIQLYEGWNMISLPPALWDVTVEDVLASIAGQYDIVQAYDANLADHWKCYNIYKPDEWNDLHQITSVKGLWVHALSDTTLIPDHKDPTTDPLFPGTNIPLYPGWNFVSYPSVTPRSVSSAMGFISYDLIQTYDAATGVWLNNDGPGGSFDTLTDMELGRGYWIHTNQAQTWSVPYA